MTKATIKNEWREYMYEQKSFTNCIVSSHLCSYNALEFSMHACVWMYMFKLNFLSPFAAVFPTRKVEAAECSIRCNMLIEPQCGSTSCQCIPVSPILGDCVPKSSGAVMKRVEEHPNLCQSHVDCMKKGSGSFCARYPNPDIEYGWCFSSNLEALNFFKIAINSELTEDFLKKPTEIVT